MSAADEDRAKAAKFPNGDILNIVYDQHAQLHELLEQVAAKKGRERQAAFAEVTALLKAHETAEEAVIRPVTVKTAGEEVAEARTEEEDEADETIVALSKLDVDGDDFEAQFAEFKQAVTDHAEAEENDEFPSLESRQTAEDRKVLGKQFMAEFEAAGGPSS